jgi:uncharacterized RDD family membrane protein YckC
MNEGPNPFEPPKADWAQSEPVSYLRDASQGARFVNAVVDGITQWLIATALALLGFGEIMSILVILAYYPFFETMYARTPGKWVTRTRVVTNDDERPTFNKILLRSLVRFIPFEPFSFFFRVRGWHDVWSGTRVVRDRKRKRRKRRD